MAQVSRWAARGQVVGTNSNPAGPAASETTGGRSVWEEKQS